MNMPKIIPIILLVLGCSIQTASAQRFKMVVGEADFRPFPVAAPTLSIASAQGDRVSRQLQSELTGILQASVDLARPLELIEPKSYLNPAGEALNAPKYKNWLNVGASGLIRGSLKLAEGNKITMTFRFFDVISQRQLLTKTASSTKEGAAQIVYQFLDELIELLTGEKGIFSSKLAYVKKTAGGKAVYISDIDGRNERRVTDPASLSLLPAWSHDGKALLFTSYLRSNPDLYRLHLASRKLDWLSHKRGLNTGASVSPDGTRIALTLSVDGNTEIYVMDQDGTNLTRLTDSWGQDVSPTWNHDGTRIAFVSSRSGNPHIFTMNADGSNPKRLSFRGDYNQEPDWSSRPGGQIVFTARDERLRYDLFLVNPDNGEMTRLTQDQGDNESPEHSPDGHQIVFTSTRPPQKGKKLYIMDVDGSNQRRVSRRPGAYETPSWGPRLGY